MGESAQLMPLSWSSGARAAVLGDLDKSKTTYNFKGESATKYTCVGLLVKAYSHTRLHSQSHARCGGESEPHTSVTTRKKNNGKRNQ